jgi:uroporphyrinogen decarboxylase
MILNSRERLKKVLEHKIPDRVPIDFGSTPGTGIAAFAYNNLINKMGINSSLRYMDYFTNQLVMPESEVIETFHVDVIDGVRAFEGSINYKEWAITDELKVLIPTFFNINQDSEGTIYLKDKNGILLGKKPKSSLYINQAFWIYKDLTAIPETIKDKDLEKHPYALQPPWHLNLFDDQQYKEFVKRIKKIYNETEYGIALTVWCNLFDLGQLLRGTENFLCDIYQDKRGVERLLDRIVEKNLLFLDKVIKGVGEYIDTLRFLDDLGTQDRPLISPEKYRDIFKPRHKKMWDFIHNNSRCKITLHSCGSIYEFLPDLIDAGLDILNPVQTSAKNMDPVRLKKEFGKDIVFWGGCADNSILINGSKKEIEENVKRRLDILGENGGLVFATIHNIQADVPPENIVTLFNAAYKYGSY